MRTPKAMWQRMNMVHKVVTVLAIVLPLIGGTFLVVDEFASHPARLNAVEAYEAQHTLEHDGIEASVDSLRVAQSRGNEKLDRVLCILEGNDPLFCERTAGGTTP